MSDFNLGTVTAYGYAKDKGYTGTEDEYAELMASYADVAEQAAESATQAAASATTASTKASEAAASATAAASSKTAAETAQSGAETAAQTATTKAGEASASATTASGKATEATTAAGTATTKASEATTAATTATTKAGEASTSATNAAASATRAQEILDSIPKDYSKMSEDVADLKDGLTLLESSNYQYLDPTTKTEYQLWTNATTKTHNDAWHGFYTYDAITLEAGDYTLIDRCYAPWSFIKFSDNTQSSVKTFVGTTNDYYSGDLHFTGSVTLCISVSRSYDTSIRLVKKSNSPMSDVPYEQGLFVGVNNIPKYSDDFSCCDQAFIKNCALTCNNDHANQSGVVAKYVRTDMGSDIESIFARVKWSGARGSVAIIVTPLKTDDGVGDIINSSIHLTFTPTGYEAILYTNRSRTSLGSYSYTVTPDTEYTIGFEINDDTITVYAPDGTNHDYTDVSISGHIGKYAIYEHYLTNVIQTIIPTSEFDHPVFTGFYCKSTDGMRLRENFNRRNGSLSVAPSGQVYELFRNTSADDTAYDNTPAEDLPTS